MKKNLLITLFLTTSLGSCFATATIADREKLIEGFKNDSGKTIDAINKQQQDGGLKVDDQHYIVVLEKISDKKYSRVAHLKKENVGKDVEASLLHIVESAEKKLNESGGDGPVSFKFIAENKDIFAVVSRFGKYIVFDISIDQKEVDAACGVKAPEKQVEESPKEEKPVQEAPKVAEKTTEAVQGQESPAPAKEAPKTEKGDASENPPPGDNATKKDSATTQDKGAN